MAGHSGRWCIMSEVGGICLLLLVACWLLPRGGYAGEAPDPSARHHGRMMTLSLRIAQAQGNERKVRKYRSLVRQYRARRNSANRVNPPGTRALRPGKTP